MREIGITAIVLGTLALAASPFVPESWDAMRWNGALWMLGAAAYGAHLWVEDRRRRWNQESEDSELP